MDELAKKLNEKIQRHEDGSIERWRDVFGYEGYYRVSDLGRIKSLDRMVKHPRGVQMLRKGVMLKVHRKSKKSIYAVVSLNKKSVNHCRTLHRVVAETFIPNPDNKPEINHKNGNKKDNRSGNLEWATRSENTIHAFQNGLITPVRGSKNNLAKLNEEQVLEIRRRLADKSITSIELAKEMNVSKGLIYMIKRRLVWKHI